MAQLQNGKSKSQLNIAVVGGGLVSTSFIENNIFSRVSNLIPK